MPAELIQLYYSIGSDILDRQTRLGWGSKVIARAAADLKSAFPDMKGFSTSNLKYMRYFAEHCPTGAFGQQAADRLPWFHVVTLLTQAQAVERQIEYAFIRHITRFLLALGADFAFVVRQFGIEVGSDWHRQFSDSTQEESAIRKNLGFRGKVPA